MVTQTSPPPDKGSTRHKTQSQHLGPLSVLGLQVAESQITVSSGITSGLPSKGVVTNLLVQGLDGLLQL